MTPFRAQVDDAILADLRERLDRARFPDQIDGAGWDYGTELSYLEELCTYWRGQFDWREQEALLNSFDQFTTYIDGISLHFIHQRSPNPDAYPLIITHGWPGSVFEFMKVIGPLTDPASHGGDPADAFHVICPSMPGYGFSSAPRERGFDIKRVAEVEAKLMAELGYTQYGAQGGDWGAVASSWLGVLDPEHCLGVHLNMPVARPPQDLPREKWIEGLTLDEVKHLMEADQFRKSETGYQSIQGTKPQTLGYGLHDSPVGLAAWIVEKFRTWSDCGGDLELRFTKDELLANITLYWVTGSITSSTRLYYESMKAGHFGPAVQFVNTPTGIAVFPGDLARLPRSWVEHHYNVMHWTEMRRGGHFAAMEEPDLLVEDIRAFFRLVR